MVKRGLFAITNSVNSESIEPSRGRLELVVSVVSCVAITSNSEIVKFLQLINLLYSNKSCNGPLNDFLGLI